jgi:uncharacterized protein (DUF433 family)
MTDHDPSTVRSSGIMAGVVVFTGTRVPIRSLVDYLKAGRGIDEFLRDHPTVGRGQIHRTLVAGLEALIARREGAASLGSKGRPSQRRSPKRESGGL